MIAARAVQTEDTIVWEEPIVYGPMQTFTTPPAAAPVIDSTSVSHVTSTDATLEAQIDTEGLPAIYDFKLSSSPCSHHGSGCEVIVPIPLLPGLLLGSFVDQSVSVDLNSAGVVLGEGEYSFSVCAANVIGSASSSARTFEAAVEPPASASQSPGDSQPSTTSGGSHPVESHPSGSTSPSSSTSASSGATPGSPLGANVGSAAKKHGARKPKRHHRHRKPKKRAERSPRKR